jgi:2-dehydro-3-deoxygluconokinase
VRGRYLKTDLSSRGCPTSFRGIYAIEIDAHGERSFRYWREASAARAMFEAGALEFEHLTTAGFCTCPASRLRSCPKGTRAARAQMKRHKAAGRDVAFDGNYRPKPLGGPMRTRDIGSVRHGRVTIALPSLDDEMALFDGADEAAVLDRLMVRAPRSSC